MSHTGSSRTWIVVSVVIAALSYLLYDACNTSLEGIDLRHKKVIVCGASTGIGRDIAKHYSVKGATVVIAARSQEKLEAIRDSLLAEGAPGPIHVVVADLSTQAACQELIQQAVSLMGGIDILVLNHITYANYGEWLPLAEKAEQLVPQMFAVNTFSYIWLSTLAMDYLKSSQGSIIVVSSLAGKVGAPRVSVYSGTKHALHGFFDSLRHELIKFNIPVSITLCVLGSIDTEAVVGVKGLVRGVGWAPPSEAAKSIIRGGALGYHETYYPFAQTWIPLVFKLFCPSLLDAIFRASMVMPSNATTTITMPS